MTIWRETKRYTPMPYRDVWARWTDTLPVLAFITDEGQWCEVDTGCRTETPAVWTTFSAVWKDVATAPMGVPLAIKWPSGHIGGAYVLTPEGWVYADHYELTPDGWRLKQDAPLESEPLYWAEGPEEM